MKRYIWLLIAVSYPLHAYSTNILFDSRNITNQTHTLFKNIAEYQYRERTKAGLFQVAKAAAALVEELNPQITTILGAEQKVFTTNCSIFFNDFVEEGGCDVALAKSRDIDVDEDERIVNPVPGTILPFHYRDHIVKRHILFARGFLDLRHDKLYGFETDLFFREDTSTPTASAATTPTATAEIPLTPSEDISETLTLTPPSRTREHTPTVSMPQSATDAISPSESIKDSESETLTSSFAPSFTQEVSVTPTQEISATSTPILSSSESTSISETLTPVVTATDSLTPSTSPTESKTPTFLASDSTSESLTLSVSTSPSDSESITHSPATISSSHTISCYNISRPVSWLANTSIYADATNQTDRYHVSCGMVLDTFSGLLWEQASSREKMSWENATDYCASRDTGYLTGWRLPTVLELQSLVDYTIDYHGPGINTTFFPTAPASRFWSSTAIAGSPARVWCISFGTQEGTEAGLWSGDYSNRSIYDLYRVRCTIGDNSTLVDRYDNTSISEVVKDKRTGLWWERTSLEWRNPYTFESFCEGRNTGGIDMWRPPTIKELATLVDYTVPRGSLTMDPVFGDEWLGWYWSMTEVSGSSIDGWVIHFDKGSMGRNIKSGNSHVRCVVSRFDLMPIPNWNASTGIYEDATNQTERYKEDDGIVTDTFSNLQWEQAHSNSTYNWTYANNTYCPSRNTGDLTGWRLPTVMELQSLVDYTIDYGDPGVNTTFFPGTPSGIFWSSLPISSSITKAWFVKSTGVIRNRNITDVQNVRCVRGSNSASIDRYDNISTVGIVKDKVTDLWWESTNGISSWNNLQSYCNSRITGGINVWRPPTIKELMTIVDYKVPPGNLTMDVVFSGIQNYYWSSSAPSGVPDEAWDVDFYTGINGFGLKSANLVIRCVVPGYDNIPTANWKASTGIYADATNQTDRYHAENGIVTDTFSNLQWEQAHSNSTYNWTYANNNYCPSSTTGGLTGWRLPTVLELQSLVDYTIPYKGTLPGINTIAFPNTPLDYFWSATPFAGGTPDQSWYVIYGKDVCANCFSGRVHSRGWSSHNVSSNGYVRCVYGSVMPQVTNDRYDNTSVTGAVKDLVTGLAWERYAGSSPYTWSNAKTHCASSTTGNLSGWRLPIIKELVTLLNYNITPGGLVMNQNVFAEEAVRYYWSSSEVSGFSGSAWLVGFNEGAVGHNGKWFSDGVRCVCDSDCLPIPNWNASTGIYEDATNQTERYKEDDGIVTDTFSNLQWEQAHSNSTYNWTYANNTYCPSRNTGDLTGWRLPTVMELQSLVDYTVQHNSRTIPGINSIAFPNTPLNYFWSSTPLAGGNPKDSWYVNYGRDACSSDNCFANCSNPSCDPGGPCGTCYAGLIYGRLWGCRYSVPDTGYIRCVRSTVTPSTFDRYDNTSAAGVVKDRLTSFEWEREAKDDARSAQQAKDYCQDLVLGNRDDWLLPSLKELSTLIDYKVDPCSSGFTINETFAGPIHFYYSSTPVAVDTGCTFGIGFGSGSTSFGCSGKYKARCVRSGSVPLPTANWKAITGVYEDATNQTERYRIEDGVVTDTFSNLQWEQANSTEKMSWQNASYYCGNSTTGGLTDWRLPAVQELQSLVDYTIPYMGTTPGVNTTFFSDTPTDYFWSSASVAGYPGRYWYVSYGKDACYAGLIYTNMTDYGWGDCAASTGNVRCIRGSNIPSPTNDRYDNTSISNVVKDLDTDLMWERYASGSTMEWQNATTYCTNQQTGEFSGWRLPSVKELSTLLNYNITPSGSNLIMNQEIFAGEPLSWYWSTTPVSGASGYVWYVYFGAGYVGFNDISKYGRARCVCYGSDCLPIANWNASTGVYEDATNQTERYRAEDGVVTDTFSNLQWEQAHSDSTYNWTYANNTYCQDRTTGDLTGWRLPTVLELQSLVDYTIDLQGTIAGINSTAFPNTPLTYFWSSTPMAGSSNIDESWYVSYGKDVCYSGLVYSSKWASCSTSSNRYLRCLRGISVQPIAGRYEVINDVVNGDVVKDKRTGLLWEKQANSDIPWSSALTYCDNRSTGGKSGWQLPTVKELSTLLDHSVVSGGLAMDNTAFAGEPNTWYWSSSPIFGASGSAWYIHFGNGVVNSGNVYSNNSVRCVCFGSDCLPIANWKAITGVYEDATNQTDRYRVNDGVVTDTFTNLQWEQANSTDRMSWSDASDYCADRTTGGLTSWRLPAISELLSLVDYTIDYKGTIPGINVTAFPNTPLNYFWSATPMAGGTPTESWYVAYGKDDCDNCCSGLIHSQKWGGPYISSDGYVRCVRGSNISSVTNDRYDNTSIPNVVRDLVTKLMWERQANNSIMSWQDAITYCTNQNTGNFSGWQLPSIKELTTLVNYNITPGSSLTMNQEIFAGDPVTLYWSLTPVSNYLGAAWYVNFGDGNVGLIGESSNIPRVRCVCFGSDCLPIANWNASTGIYEDATNQTGRYKVDDGVVTDTFSNLQWEQAHSDSTYNWTYANNTYCPSSTTGGLTGWRLPTALELQSLVDYTIPMKGDIPGINTTVFPNTPLNYFWSSTPLANGAAEESWYVSFGKDACTGGNCFANCSNPSCTCGTCSPCHSGLVTTRAFGCCYSVYDTGYVRCVRSVIPSLVDRYDISVTGVVKDRLTNLEWERAATSDYRIWQPAKDYCDGLNFAGRSDWRLPTIKELTTVLDFQVAIPCSNKLNMNETFSGAATWYWSSTLNSDYAWLVPFLNGGVNVNAMSRAFRVRCVRP